jgi:hypothetical protein
MPNVISLHRRLDRLGDDGASTAEALEQSLRAHEVREAAWRAGGHPGAPPHRQLPRLAADAPHRCGQLWRLIANGRGRVIHGKDPESSPFANLQAIYTMPDDALLAAINGHPLYAGWPGYD